MASEARSTGGGEADRGVRRGDVTFDLCIYEDLKCQQPTVALVLASRWYERRRDFQVSP